MNKSAMSFSLGLTPLSFAGVGRRMVRRPLYYHPYAYGYRPPCGYHPYPPCY